MYMYIIYYKECLAYGLQCIICCKLYQSFLITVVYIIGVHELCCLYPVRTFSEILIMHI